MTETVNVTGEAPTVDPERAGLAVNINNAALTSLPVSTQRRYQDIWALVPGVFVRPDQADINPSVNSRGTSENSTKLDGMDVTDPFGGGVFSVELQLRRDPGHPDQDARRRGRRRRPHRRLHDDRDQERRQRAARLGGVLRHPARRSTARTSPASPPNQRKDVQPGPDARRPDRAGPDLVLRRVSPRAGRSDAEQRAGAARAARQSDLRQGHHRAEPEPPADGVVPVRPDHARATP